MPKTKPTDKHKTQASFVQVPHWLLCRSDLTSTAKLVYAQIVYRMNGTATSWPGYRSLASDLGVSKSAIERSIHQITNSKILIREVTQNGKSVYRRPQISLDQHPKVSSKRGHLHSSTVLVSMTDVSSFRGQRCPQNEDINRTIEIEQEKEINSTTISSDIVEIIYDAYPRHINKKNDIKVIQLALEKLRKRSDIKDPSSWLLDRVKLFAKTRINQDQQFTPYPTTWFGNERYYDEYYNKQDNLPESNPWEKIGSDEYYKKLRA